MLLAISDFCSRTVERFGASWGYLGWGLWATRFVWAFLALPVLFQGGSMWWFVTLGWVFFAVWLLWWLFDVIDQQVSLWQVILGIIMLGLGFLPRGGLLALAAWIIYWTRVRE